MGKYKIEIKKSAAKELYSIPKKDLQKIISRIKVLSDNPRPKDCVKISGQKHYRLRHGNYRIVYSVEDELLVVYVVKIGHRKHIYR